MPLYKHTFTFLTACHLKKHKGIDLVIRAFHDAFPSDDKVGLIIAGDGLERNNLERLVESMNDARVSFIGRYNRDEISRVFSSADAFVLTSAVEPFGIVYIEAQMFGLPCIATKGQGGDDIIGDECGYLVDYGNLRMLSKTMRNVYLKRWDRSLIQKECIQKFSEDSICSIIERVYEKINEEFNQ